MPEQKWEKSWPMSALPDQALREEIERMMYAHSQPVKNSLEI